MFRFTGRSFTFLFVVLLSFAAPVAQAQIQPDSDYFFEADSGNVVFSNVTVGYVDAGYGNYVAMITVTPTQEEINQLLADGWSHVDFDFHFHGLRASSGVDFAPAVSDYVRQVGARVDHEAGYPVYRALGLNIELRWVADQPFTVLAPIFGYQPSGEGRPSVSVEMVSSRWWFADGQCAATYERTTNNETLQYCTVQDHGSRAFLYDEYRDVRIPLR